MEWKPYNTEFYSHPCYSFLLYSRAALAWTNRNVHLEMRNYSLSVRNIFTTPDLELLNKRLPA